MSENIGPVTPKRTPRLFRRLKGTTIHRLQSYIAKDAYEDLCTIAGPANLSMVVEALIRREKRRRDRRLIGDTTSADTSGVSREDAAI